MNLEGALVLVSSSPMTDGIVVGASCWWRRRLDLPTAHAQAARRRRSGPAATEEEAGVPSERGWWRRALQMESAGSIRTWLARRDSRPTPSPSPPESPFGSLDSAGPHGSLDGPTPANS